MSRLVTKEDRLAARWRPQNSEEIILADGLGVVYTYGPGGKFFAVAYTGTAGRPTWHHAFRTAEARAKYIDTYADNLRSHKQRVAEYRREREPSDHARAAAFIKRQLASLFPGVKFSVRSECYTGGDSVHISWTLGPTTDEVEAIGKAHEEGSFDGSIDLYEYDNDPGRRAFREMFGSAKYVFGNRRYAPDELALYEQIGRDLCALQRVEFVDLAQRDLCGSGGPFSLRDHAYQLLARTSFTADEHYAGVEYTPEADRKAGRDWCRIVKAK